MELKVTINRQIVDVILPKLKEYNGTFELKQSLEKQVLEKWEDPKDLPFNSINKSGIFVGCIPSIEGDVIFYDYVEFSAN